MRMRLSAVFLILFGLAGCTKSNLTTENSQKALNYYLTPSSLTRIYWMDSGLGTFVSQLEPVDGELVLPNSLLAGDYGDRSESNTAYPLSLLAKVYVPNHPSGDFYFESPVLGPRASVSNVTTALTWYLRWGFNGAAIKMSKVTFDKIAMNIEVACTQCRKKTNSEVLSFILASDSLKQAIKALAAAENPGLTLQDIWTTPAPIWAWSEPLLSLHGAAAKTVKENQPLTLSVWYVDPMHSNERITPGQWGHTFQSSTESLSGAQLDYTFTYQQSGAHVFRPTFPPPVPDDGINFQVTVEDQNRNPLCTSPLQISMRANTLNSIDLSTFCYDLDADNTSLTYALGSGPSGFVVTAAGIAKWLPPPSSDGSAYTSPFTFSLADAKLGLSSQSGVVTVSADHSPVFTSILSTYSFTEGTPSTFTVNAQDADGDPLVLTLKSDTPVANGFPDGAGSLAQITRTGSAGTYSFQVTFTPSYLQTIGTNGTMNVHFVLSYDNTSGNYNPTAKFDDRLVTFNITNTDDPPQWDSQPADLNATEGTDFGGVLVGHAADPNPNSTAVSYVVTNRDEEHCQWAADLNVTTDVSGNAYLHGAPAYYSKSTCQFTIIATDASGLSSESSVFSVETANVNQPVSVLPTALTIVTGQEGKSMNLPLTEIFSDPDVDSSPTDNREDLTYTCLVDVDGDLNYESTCSSQNLNFNLNNKYLIGSWTPPAFSAGTYHVRLTITDVGGVSATADFDLIVQQYATAMALTAVYNGSETSTVSVAENSNTSLILRATAASARPIDTYAFTVNTPTCTVLGGSGGCSVSLITSPGSLDGTGTTDFTFALKPSYTDADSGFPNQTKKYILSFYAQKSDDPTVYMQHSITVTVTNTNRAPTAIGLTKGNFGCAGSTENTSPDPFTVCVDASQDKKSGNSWSKSYSVPLVSVDADTVNDSYSFGYTETLAPGSVLDNTWTFKFPACMNAGTGTVTRTYNLNLYDGRGGVVTRPVILKIVKASASSACL